MYSLSCPRSAPLAAGSGSCGWRTARRARRAGRRAGGGRAGGGRWARCAPGGGASRDGGGPGGAAAGRLFGGGNAPRRGEPLPAAGLDEILDGARSRAGLERATCHQLRHTCFTRLREAGMALEAIQAPAGHASIESIRLYLHPAHAWLAEEYLRAAEAIDALSRPC